MLAIKEIKNNLDIVSVIRQYLPGLELKRKGNKFWINCPFHNEKTPSCAIYPSENRFHCYGCGADGDTLDFIAAITGRSLGQVIKDLAKNCNITLNYTPGKRTNLAARFALEVDSAYIMLSRRYRLLNTVIDRLAQTAEYSSDLFREALDIRNDLESILDDLNMGDTLKKCAALNRVRGGEYAT